MAQCVAGDLKDGLLGQLYEIKRQIRQSSGYPYDPMALRRHLQDAIEGRFNVVKSLLLEFLGTVMIPATRKFVAQEKFVVDTSGAVVKISYVGDNFKEWFLGKTEKAATEVTLRYAKLLKPLLDKQIRDEIGRAHEETTLAQIFTLMERQPNGKDGILFTNGYANIFYVKDVKESLRAVVVLWRDGGWYVFADSVSSTDGWRGGDRVFSRNSLVALTV